MPVRRASVESWACEDATPASSQPTKTSENRTIHLD
jgi:hypothetical protein